MERQTWAERLFGRSNRTEFWIGLAVVWLASVGLTQLTKTTIISHILLLLPALLVYTRRLHDMGRTWWWSLAPMAFGSGFDLLKACLQGLGYALPSWLPVVQSRVFAIVMLVFVLILGFAAGTAGPSRYGPQPGKRKVDPAVFD